MVLTEVTITCTLEFDGLLPRNGTPAIPVPTGDFNSGTELPEVTGTETLDTVPPDKPETAALAILTEADVTLGG